MMRICALLLVAGAAAALGAPPADRELIREAAAQQPATGAPPAAAAQPEERGDEERAARAEANLALARLELVLGRKGLAAEQFTEAARHAQRALVLLRQVPPEVATDEYELQAEGILARAARAGVNVEALARDAAAEAPLLEGDAVRDRQAQGAARVARQYSGPPRPDVDSRGDARVLRERALRRRMTDPYGYRPGAAILDVDAVLAADEQRLYYQGVLRDAVKADEVRLLVSAEEARLVPEGDVAYPADWPERVRRRAKWAEGAVARSASWYDEQGREWYVAVYDIRDIIYVPPDFGHYGFFGTPGQQRMMSEDRRQFWRNSSFWWGGWGAGDGGIPMLRYFGGLNPWFDRGEKYSLERQREVVRMIEAFTGTRADAAAELPPAPR